MIKYQHFKILAVRGLHITKMSVLSLKETLLLLSVTAATFSLWWEVSVGFPSPPLAISLNPVFHYCGQIQWRCSQGGVGGLSLDPEDLGLFSKLSLCDRFCFCFMVQSTNYWKILSSVMMLKELMETEFLGSGLLLVCFSSSLGKWKE